ncbi:MAG: hypothetical protein OQL08_11350 [Gammaproteobacteria bacterium]|nr:hypothetical protein [Gammaproteobacteria bacterium]
MKIWPDSGKIAGFPVSAGWGTVRALALRPDAAGVFTQVADWQLFLSGVRDV